MSLEIAIDHDRCKRCGICIDACPIPCFYETGNRIRVTRQDMCIVCRNCEENCPTACISVSLGQEER